MLIHSCDPAVLVKKKKKNHPNLIRCSIRLQPGAKANCLFYAAICLFKVAFFSSNQRLIILENQLLLTAGLEKYVPRQLLTIPRTRDMQNVVCLRHRLHRTAVLGGPCLS